MLENELSPTLNSTVYLKDYQPPAYLIEHVSLDFQLGSEFTEVVAVLNICKAYDHSDALRLDGEKFELVSVHINDQQLVSQELEVDSASLTIVDMPDQCELRIHTRLQPHLNTELSGLYQSSGNFCTQCEAEGFRRITYFLDRPDVLATYDVTITGDEKNYPILLSNGNPAGTGSNSDGTHWARWHDPHPKPCYLFALVAGDLQHISDAYKTLSGADVELNIYTQAHNIDKCQHAMDSLKASMRWDEQVYGREYDLRVYNVVAVDDFNMGAMENKGLNVFNSKYVLADQQTATDTDYQGIEAVIGHEYFHNWSGNRVTCRDWFQLSLKEGFTVFRDQEFSADMGSRAVKRIGDVQTLRTHQFKEDAGPMAHPVRPSSYEEINNFYTVTIYEKGAELIRMMYSIVGIDGFRKATDLYFARFDGQAVTTEDFVQCMEEVNQVDLKQFRYWYTQAGTPEVTVEQSFDVNDECYTLKLTQSCPSTPEQKDKQPFYIPVAIALIDQAGQLQHEESLLMTEASQEFTFNGWQQAPVLSFLRGFSAPIKVTFKQSDSDLAHLIRYDNDGFTRWEAMQRLSLNLMLPLITGKVSEFDVQRYAQLVSALQNLIESEPKDKAILAEMLKLPSASYIAELSRPIRVSSVYQVRENLELKLAKDLQTHIEQLYIDNAADGEFSLSSEAIAARALKNCALGYLLILDQQPFYQLALEQYTNANNMTDRLAAFGALIHSEYGAKQSLIDHFYNDWQNESLVLDKWFTMQATVPTAKTLDSVQQLLKHSAFSIANPNKVRSLISAYTTNMPSFHQENGSGYQFLADKIIELNTINPQIAARLATSLTNWRAYAEPQSSLMRAQLERINGELGLSKDVKEIVCKAI